MTFAAEFRVEVTLDERQLLLAEGEVAHVVYISVTKVHLYAWRSLGFSAAFHAWRPLGFFAAFGLWRHLRFGSWRSLGFFAVFGSWRPLRFFAAFDSPVSFGD